MKTVTLNGKPYRVQDNEFQRQHIEEFCNLEIYPDLGPAERLAGLLCDIAEEIFGGADQVAVEVHGWRRGGFIPLECAGKGLACRVFGGAAAEILFPVPLTLEIGTPKGSPAPPPNILFLEEGFHLPVAAWPEECFVLAPNEGVFVYSYVPFPLADSPYTLYVPIKYILPFRLAFRYSIRKTTNQLTYDNLLHLVIMVKNAGAGFEDVLKKTVPHIDRWTVLDTGSTDGTQEVVRRVLGTAKPGSLFEEPFVNFRESRNRSLELASRCGGHCKFTIILDDTYWIDGPLRSFLQTVRGDQYATSYSAMILSGDSEYYSNRIIKTATGLRYMYTIHEVIQEKGNTNVVIPKGHGWLVDECSPYMEGRTKDRKRRDIELLEGMLVEDPDNPRHLYYLAQTYKCLEDWSKTEEYFRRRIEFPKDGFLQEKVDACFELARLMNFQLGRPWEECKAMYERAFELEPSRPDPLYFIGVHYMMTGVAADRRTAFDYFKRAIAIGYPIHTQYSLKPTLFYHFLPKFLTPLCYDFEEFQLGEAASDLFLRNNKPTEDGYEVISNWNAIFKHLVRAEKALTGVASSAQPNASSQKPLVVFVADGGFAPWTGRDILTKGVGGSETYIIEMARGIQAAGRFRAAVICNCRTPDTFEGVEYIPLETCYDYLAANPSAACIVSRFSEYVPACIRLPSVSNVYLVLHDLGPSGNIIPLHDKLRGIFCLTEWHKSFFLESFPQFADRTHAFGYGINSAVFDRLRAGANPPVKVPHRFIYSSFPNRGLLPLLKMWPRIQTHWPDASLEIYADLSNAWVNRVAGAEVAAIREALAGLKTSGARVTVKGWVDKETLARAWLEAEVWFYPCTFKETFCLTAFEAAASNTLAITNDLAALQNTVGDRGIIVAGDATTAEWQQRAVDTLFSALDSPETVAYILEKNAAHVAAQSWPARAAEFEERFLRPLAPAPALAPATALAQHKNVRAGLNYAEMYNWTNDLPENSRPLFEDALKQATTGKAAPRILEIGTYAGTSVIEMLRLVPTATATTIDRWEDYDEFGNPVLSEIGQRNIMHTFFENLRAARVAARVQALKGDSAEQLLELVATGVQPFDFIYVDGSHKCLDCYVDMVIAWRLLSKGGILAVDDVLFKAERATAGEPLEVPYLGVKHFVDKYKGHFEIVSSGYRIYLRKV